MHAVNEPEVMVSHAREKFDANGKLKDEKTRKSISELIESLISLAEKWPNSEST
jgi:chromate reductase